MGNMLGRGKPLKEVLRENKRMISRAVRELDREKNGLEREEQRLKVEIKKAAKENQMQSVKIMAKVGGGWEDWICSDVLERRRWQSRTRFHGMQSSGILTRPPKGPRSYTTIHCQVH